MGALELALPSSKKWPSQPGGCNGQGGHWRARAGRTRKRAGPMHVPGHLTEPFASQLFLAGATRIVLRRFGQLHAVVGVLSIDVRFIYHFFAFGPTGRTPSFDGSPNISRR